MAKAWDDMAADRVKFLERHPELTSADEFEEVC